MLDIAIVCIFSAVILGGLAWLIIWGLLQPEPRKRTKIYEPLPPGAVWGHAWHFVRTETPMPGNLRGLDSSNHQAEPCDLARRVCEQEGDT